MAENNATIMDRVWLQASTDYQQRVPRVTQGNIAQQVQFFENPGNRPFWNQFVDALVNRIGDVIPRSRRWDNPLAAFKRGMLNWGDTIEEVGAKLITARGYDICDGGLLGCYPPEYMSAFHTVTREDKYPISVSIPELRKAFLSEYGLNEFVNTIMDIPINSDNQDEYDIMINILAEYDKKWGFFRQNVPDLMTSNSIDTDSRKWLRTVRSLSGRMKFQLPYFNAYGLPVFTKPQDLVLITTPENKAAIDVEALAMLFNIGYGEIDQRIVEVLEFPIDGAQGLLVDKDWFICADYVYENESFYDPSTLKTNYFLHHWGVYSASPMLNAVLLTTETTSSITTVAVDLTDVAIDYATVDGAKPTFAKLGGETQLEVTVNGTVAPENPNIHVPQGVFLEIVASDKTLDPHTYVHNNGVLTVAAHEQATNLTVKATAAYVDPSKPIAGQTPITKEMVIGIGKAYTPPVESDAVADGADGDIL